MTKKIVKVNEYQRVKKGKVEDVSKHKRHIDTPEVSKKDVKNVKTGKFQQLNLGGYFVESGNFRVKPKINSSKGVVLDYFCSTYDRELAKSKVKAIKSGNVESKWVIGGISGTSVFRIYSNQVPADVGNLQTVSFEPKKKDVQKIKSKKSETKGKSKKTSENKINSLEKENQKIKRELIDLDLNRQDQVDRIKSQWYTMMVDSKDKGSKSIYYGYITRDIKRYDAKMNRLRKKIENNNVKILKVKLNYDKVSNALKNEFGASGKSKWVPSKKVLGAGGFSEGYVIVGPTSDSPIVSLTYRAKKGNDEFKKSSEFREKIVNRFEAEKIPYDVKGETIVIK